MRSSSVIVSALPNLYLKGDWVLLSATPLMLRHFADLGADVNCADGGCGKIRTVINPGGAPVERLVIEPTLPARLSEAER